VTAYSTLGPRKKPLARTVQLQRSGQRAGTVPLANHTTPQRRAGIKPVSAKRAAENRQRRAMVDDLFKGERPLCAVPWCGQWADDLHEPLTRARGGSITDRENCIPLCRKHHDDITFRPESELGWAYQLGLLVHSWDAPAGGAA
jgi:hypothetical protein